METKNYNCERTVSIGGVLRCVLKKRAGVLLSGCVLALCSVIFFSFISKPSYTTTATFAVTNTRSSSSTMAAFQSNQELADVLTKLLSSDTLNKTVCTNLGIEEFPGEISASAIAETNFFTLSVSADSPRDSYLYFKVVEQAYPQLSQTVVANAVVTRIKAPVIPQKPSSGAGTLKTTVLAFLLGAFAYAFIIAVLYITRNTVKSASAAEKLTDCKVIAQIPFEEQNGSKRKNRISVIDLKRSFAFSSAYEALRASVETAAANSGLRTIVVTSAGDEEGKTSVAANLALSLSLIGKHVLLLDCNFLNPKIAEFFGVEIPSDAQLSSYLSGDPNTGKIIRKFKEMPLYIAGSSKPAQGSSDIVMSSRIKSFIEKAGQRYDYIIMDTPAIESRLDAAELADISDASILVVRGDCSDASSVSEAVRILSGKNAELIGIVYNFSDKAIFSDKTEYGAYRKSERRAK